MIGFPDFIVLGAPKSGTTSLYFYLKQHPQIFLPSVKEPNFFAYENMDMNDFYYPKEMSVRSSTVTKLESYNALYQHKPTDQMGGDMSTIYLSSPAAPSAIKKYAPHAKLIAILRNPVDRAFSNFTHLRNDDLEPEKDLLRAVMLEGERRRDNWYEFYSYTRVGMYSEQLKRYYDLFPKEQIRVYLYEDLKNMDVFIKDALSFIGVDPEIDIDTSFRFNATGRKPRVPWLHRILRGDKNYKKGVQGKISTTQWAKVHTLYDKLMLGEPAKMTTDERKALVEIFRADIEKTAAILGRDLSPWLEA